MGETLGSYGPFNANKKPQLLDYLEKEFRTIEGPHGLTTLNEPKSKGRGGGGGYWLESPS